MPRFGRTGRLLLVTGVALVRHQGRRPEVLIAQRPEGKGNAGLWEFPGGKVCVAKRGGANEAAHVGRHMQPIQGAMQPMALGAPNGLSVRVSMPCRAVFDASACMVVLLCNGM
jgi:hypothetical protein